MFYLPPGSMMQLIDGRVLHKNQKTNMWHDNMGVPISEQQLHFMMSFPSFSEDPSGGGDSPNLTFQFNADFDDIGVTLASTTTSNANRILSIGRSLLPQTLRLDFAAGGTYAAGAGTTLTAFKNDVGITAIGITSVAPSSLQLGGFNNGDQLSFSMFVPSGSALDFNATVVGVPGIPPEKNLDTFRISASLPAELTSVSLSAPFGDIVVTNAATDTFNANRTIVIVGSGSATLRVTFASVGTYNNGTFKAYKNDVQINSIRVGFSSAGLVTTLSETFANGDQLKFSHYVPNSIETEACNFNVTLEKTAPGSTDVLDVFNVSTLAS